MFFQVKKRLHTLTKKQNKTHQVVLPALGCVFRIPFLLWRAHRRIHIGRVSIAVVSWIISPVPTSPSHSGELKSKQDDFNIDSEGGIINKKTNNILIALSRSESTIDLWQWEWQNTIKLDEKSGIFLLMRWSPTDLRYITLIQIR